MSDKLKGWKKSAVATAAVLGLLSGHAYALTLGGVTVQSALGEPLRAQIEVTDISAEEAASLKTAIAAPDAFNAAGLQYNPVMPDLQVRLQKQANGRAVIELSSQRLINDPFIDLLIEASWASGRIIRDYTLLFDPPSLQKANPLPPTPAQVPAEAAKPTGAAPAATTAPATPPQAAASAPLQNAGPSAKPPAQGNLQVKSGDTASAIVLRNKPANISLDQMLVALLRANPNAFVNNNVNRLKTGAVMAMPSAAMAGLESAEQARQIVIAQSLDFNDYRRKLAGATPKSAVLSADRKASGTLQAQVEDKKVRSPSPDKLTLSKGGVKAVSPEAIIATELAAKDSAERAAEIAKNISDLSKLSVTTNAAAPPPLLPPSAPASASIAPTMSVTPSPQVSAAIAAAPAPKSAASATPMSSPGWLEKLINNPYTPLGAVGLMVALAGFGVFRHKQRNKVQNSILGEHFEAQTPGEYPALHEAPEMNAAPIVPAHPMVANPGLVLPAEELTAPRPKSDRDLDLDLDLELDLELEPDDDVVPANTAPIKRQEPATLAESIDLALPDLDIFTAPEVGKPVAKVADPKPRPPPPSSAPVAASAPDLNTLDFDLGALSLDLDDAVDEETTASTSDSQDPLETKLALAHEFSAIGDEHGARALIEEVIAEASGAMKTKAKLALSQLQVS